MSDVHNLGDFQTIKDVWKKFPNGGGFGDYVTIIGVRHDWDEYKSAWGNETTEIDPPVPEVLHHDLEVQGSGKFRDGIQTGEYVERTSGASIDKDGNGDFRTVSIDTLIIKDPITGEHIPLSAFIKKYKTELPPDWADYEQIIQFDSVRILAFDPLSNEKFYTTIGALKKLISDSISAGTTGGGTFVIQILRSDDPEGVPTDNNVLSSLATLLAIQAATNSLIGQFLSKTDDDTAQGVITFLKGLITATLEVGGESLFRGLARALEGIKVDGESEMESLTADELIVKTRAILEEGFKTGNWGLDGEGNFGAKKVTASEALFGNITLQNGMKSPVFFPGIFGEGFNLRKKDGTANQWVLEIQDLILNGTLDVNEILVRKWTHVGAGYIFSSAGFEIDKVEELSDRFRVYPSKPEENDYRLYDQALCQSFNLDGTRGSLKRYWRLVIGIAADRSYIDLSKTVTDGSGIPEAGDDIIQLGFRGSDNSRKGAIIISSIGEDGPYFQSLRGIDSFDLSNKTQIFIGNETEFNVDRFSIKSGNSYHRVPVDRGEFRQGTTYYYYDRVTYNGAIWLCMIDSTTAPPSETYGGWEKQTNVKVGGKNLLREYDLRFGGKYWGVEELVEGVNYVEVDIDSIMSNTPYLNISPTSINWAYTDYTSTIAVKSNKPWTVEAPAWLSLNPLSGTGDRVVSVSAQPYTGRSNRTGSLIFKSTGLANKTIPVTHTGKPEFVIIDQFKTVQTNGGSVVITGKTNSPRLTFTLGAGAMAIVLPSQYPANGSSTNNGANVSGDPGASYEFNFSIVLSVGQNLEPGSLERPLIATTNNGQTGICVIVQTQSYMLLGSEDNMAIVTEDGLFIDLK